MAIVAAHPQTYTGNIQNIDFFPDLDIETFQKKYKVNTSVDKSIIEEALGTAMLDTNDELEVWMQRQLEAGYKSLDEVPTTQHYGDKSKYHITYLKAVYSQAKVQTLRDFGQHDLTNEGDEKWKDNNEQARHYERMHTSAIRKIKGKAGTTSVSLI